MEPAKYYYNVCKITVLLYVAQLYVLPPKLREIGFLNSALHMANAAFTLGGIIAFRRVGGPEYESIGCSAAAALFRTAAKTLPNWAEWLAQLEQVALSTHPLGQIGRSQCFPKF